MTLKNFAVVTGGHREDGVLAEYWDGVDRCIAIFQRTVLDDAFDHMLQLGPPNRRLHPHEWNILAEESPRVQPDRFLGVTMTTRSQARGIPQGH